MKLVYEVHRDNSIRSRPWWQTVRLVEFEDRILLMEERDLELLYLDLRRAVSQCGQRASDTSLDDGERHRARTALRFLTHKRDTLRLELVKRGRFGSRKDEGESDGGGSQEK